MKSSPPLISLETKTNYQVTTSYQLLFVVLIFIYTDIFYSSIHDHKKHLQRLRQTTATSLRVKEVGQLDQKLNAKKHSNSTEILGTSRTFDLSSGKGTKGISHLGRVSDVFTARVAC